MAAMYFYLLALLSCLTIVRVAQADGNLELLQLKTETSAATQKEAVSKLIERLLGKDAASHFEVVIDENFTDGHLDKYRLELAKPGHFRVTGNSGVSASMAVHHFLKYVAQCSYSWSGDQLDLPQLDTLRLTNPIERTVHDKLRYYQNVCTASYSSVWWSWARWEREIDWMALRGINMPLAFNGQELVFRNTFKRFNLNDAEINDYFSGPAFLAWNRMGNIQKWSGPLSESWHQHQAQLQKQILQRMHEFGMFPVTPGFAGHVPRALPKHMSRAKVENLTDWCGFGRESSCTSFLQPADPNFASISAAFLEEYKKLYGLSHFYNIDLFNEVNPASNDPAQLKLYGKTLFDSILKVDPKAVWVMQGWMFFFEQNFWKSEQIKAMVTSVPTGKMIVLDLYSDAAPFYSKTNGYYGQTFLWCMLQNFGGSVGLYGPFNRINDELFKTRKNYKNMVGIGLTPEGIHQNDIVYDYMTEVVIHTEPPYMKTWFSTYVHRRYGFQDTSLVQAWQLLRESVYHDPNGIRNDGNYAINRRPKIDHRSNLWYEPKKVVEAFKFFAAYWDNTDQAKAIKSDTLVADTVDIARQVLQLTFDVYNENMRKAYVARDLRRFKEAADAMNHLFELKEDILGCSRFFLLHNWIEDARALGADAHEKDVYEELAKNQLTLWGPNGNILDYASKQWADMYRYYYQPRWQLYIRLVNDSMVAKQGEFDYQAFEREVFAKVELPFTKQKHPLKEKATPENLPKLLPKVSSILHAFD